MMSSYTESENVSICLYSTQMCTDYVAGKFPTADLSQGFPLTVKDSNQRRPGADSHFVCQISVFVLLKAASEFPEKCKSNSTVVLKL